MKPLKVVLDTNILISGWIFKNNCQAILNLVREKKIAAYTSPLLLAELTDVIYKKFPQSIPFFPRFYKEINATFGKVHPDFSIDILADKADNRVLEAAIKSRSSSIVTADKALLALNTYQNITIISPSNFLQILL